MPGIDASYILLLHDHLRGHGIEAETVLGRAPAQGARVSVLRWQWMLERIAASTGSEAPGLRIADALRLRHFGSLGSLLMACATLREVMPVLHRHGSLVQDLSPVTIQVFQGQVELDMPPLYGWLGRTADEVGLATLLGLLRLLSGQPLRVTRAEFVGPPPENRAPYQDFFGGEVVFDRDTPRLMLPLSCLDLPVIRATPERFAGLEAKAGRAVRAMQPLSPFLTTLRAQLVLLLPRGLPRIDDLALASGMNVRTLQRRLAAQDMSFRPLLDLTRRELAEHYLATPTLRIPDIAPLLGFGGVEEFTVAFVRWTGETPGQWRHRLRARQPESDDHALFGVPGGQ